MKYVQTHILTENLCALPSFLVCARLSSLDLCAHTRAQLRGNIAGSLIWLLLWYIADWFPTSSLSIPEKDVANKCCCKISGPF